MTTAPTRALVNGRNHRARHAQYVSDLEERVRRMEAENAQLRVTLDTIHASNATLLQVIPEFLTPLNALLDQSIVRHHGHLFLSTTLHTPECTETTCSVTFTQDNNDTKG